MTITTVELVAKECPLMMFDKIHYDTYGRTPAGCCRALADWWDRNFPIDERQDKDHDNQGEV